MQNEACFTEESEEIKDQSIQTCLKYSQYNSRCLKYNR